MTQEEQCALVDAKELEIQECEERLEQLEGELETLWQEDLVEEARTKTELQFLVGGFEETHNACEFQYDYTAKREAWLNYLDIFCVDGDITEEESEMMAELF